MSHRILEPGSISFPLFGSAISPCFPTAHSMNSPGPTSVESGPGAELTRGSRDPGSSCMQSRHGVMRDPAALDRRRPDLDRAHPSRFGETSFNSRLVPRVLRDRRHGERRRSDDEVRRTKTIGECPDVLVRELFRRRHVLRVAFRRTRIDPSSDVSICSSVSDRSFSKCWIPTVRSICHGGICLATTRALIARAHGRDSAKVIERHRRDVAGAMARLTLVLEDRRDVFGEGHGCRAGLFCVRSRGESRGRVPSRLR